MSPKNKKEHKTLHEIFFNLQYKCAEVPTSRISKIDSPIFCCPLFFKEFLNPEVRINKMVNEYTVDYDPRPSEFKDTPSYFCGFLSGLSL